LNQKSRKMSWLALAIIVGAGIRRAISRSPGLLLVVES
jgi:hypothetical protein